MKKFLFVGSVVLTVGFTRGEFIVAPNDRATQSGNAFMINGFRTPATFQNVYQPANFSGPVVISGIAFRQNEGSGGLSFEAVIPRLRIQLSTYSGNLAGFNFSDYNSNKGLDDLTAFDGSIRWTTTDLPGSEPNSFDLGILFTQPFTYDPRKGALLINYTSFGPFTSGLAADSHAHGDAGIGWAGDTLGNLVMQFNVTPIPEPSTLALAISMLVLFLRKTP